MIYQVAVVMGGYSSESEVSLKSGQTVLDHLDRSRFDAYAVHIYKEKWTALIDEQEYPINRNDFSVSTENHKITFDGVFNALHGSPGEDGLLAGYFEMLGIPQTACNTFESALTFNKVECTQLCKLHGAVTPDCVVLLKNQHFHTDDILNTVGLPCFVKPSRSGSSIGVTRVKDPEQLYGAIEHAFSIDDKVIVEEMIKGTEVGCGVSNHSGKTEALAITDIVPLNDFFDYESKYSGASEEITPARISDGAYQQIMEECEFLYDALRLDGLVRMDYIISENDVPFFIEINTIPGLSPASIVPKQIKYKNLAMGEVFGQLLINAIENKKS